MLVTHGVDININVTGKTVIAAADGTVVTSTALRDDNGNYRSYGEYIIIEHTSEDGNTYYTLYAHMLSGSRQVSVGDTVVQGQVIGIVGSTGNSTGPHLHFEIRNSDGTAINPLPYLKNTL